MANKSQHYWSIHRIVTMREWKSLPLKVADIIAADTEHNSLEFKEFSAFVNGETERLVNDPQYYRNDPYRFKYPQFEEAA